MELRYAPLVQQALADGRAVVALESTVITHGLPRPQNLELAHSLQDLITEGGAVPATIGLLGGEIWIGLSDQQLEELANDSQADKASLWNLAALVAKGANAGTTVASTALLARRAGIEVFSTGGIGGVHQGEAFDESADLGLLARTPILVVCAGAKSILDLPATLERLESYGVAMVGYQTAWLPAFHTPHSPYQLPAQAQTPQELARILRVNQQLGLGAVLALNPVSDGLPYAQVEDWVVQANQEAHQQQISGKQLTPFLLRRLAELSQGQTDQVNLRLLRENARLSAQIAVALVQSASYS